MIAHIFTDYKIVAAIINCFYIKLLSDGDNASNIAIRMNNKIAQKNINLDKYWNSINDKDFMLIDANNVKDFPKIDQETLRSNITFGSYQLKNSFGCLSEHLIRMSQLSKIKNSNSFHEEINEISMVSILKNGLFEAETKNLHLTKKLTSLQNLNLEFEEEDLKLTDENQQLKFAINQKDSMIKSMSFDLDNSQIELESLRNENNELKRTISSLSNETSAVFTKKISIEKEYKMLFGYKKKRQVKRVFTLY